MKAISVALIFAGLILTAPAVAGQDNIQLQTVIDGLACSTKEWIGRGVSFITSKDPDVASAEWALISEQCVMIDAGAKVVIVAEGVTAQHLGAYQVVYQNKVVWIMSGSLSTLRGFGPK